MTLFKKRAIPLKSNNIRLYLNKFRGQPANLNFDWLFTALINSSDDFAASISSVY